MEQLKEGWIDTNQLSTEVKREACNERGGKMRMFWESFSSSLPSGDFMLVNKGRIVAGFFRKPENYFIRNVEKCAREHKKKYNL